MKRSLSICKVWDGEYPWDVRAEKVARSLTDAGHRVSMVARNRTGLPLVEQLPEATIYRLAPWGGVPRSVSAASMFPAFLNPRWLRAIRRVAEQVRADLILCRDLPLAIPSILVARRLGIPVIMDMAENYPAMLRSRWATGRMRPIDLLVRNPTATRLVERWVLSRLDGVMVVVEESAARLRAEGVPDDTIIVVSNTPPLSRLGGNVARHSNNGTTCVVYLGLLELQRGIGTLVEAMSLVSKRDPSFRLTVYGDGRDAHLFHAQAEGLGLAPDTITFKGRVDNEAALRELGDAHIGVVPHWRDDSWNTTIPNKLFDYMASGLAVVTSDAAPAARIVESTGAGRVFRDREASELADALYDLSDPDARRQSAERGRAAIRETYNWERDVERMLRLVEIVMSRAGSGAGR